MGLCGSLGGSGSCLGSSGGLGSSGSLGSSGGLSSDGGAHNRGGGTLSLVLDFLEVVSSFLDESGKSFFVLSSEFLLSLVSQDLSLLLDYLSSKSSLSDKSLDLGGLVESLITFLDFSSDNVLSNIISLSQSEDLSNIVSSLRSESSGLITVSNTFDFSLSLLNDSESNNSKIGSTDASSD